jgi:hypothetical protein
MDTLLIVVTGLSLAMAISMGMLVMKLLREERRRSDARIATLLDMAAGPPQTVERPSPAVSFNAPAPPAVAIGRSASRAAQPADREVDLDLRPSPASSVAVSHLFSEPAQSSPWLARLAVAAGLAVLITGVGYGWLSSSSRTVPAVAVDAGAAMPAATPLELLSLRHSQEDDGLAVTGLVQNPRSGATLTRVIATAIALDADGTFLASGRAPLDFTTLAAGTESPFVVHIPVTGKVARYRIGFRAEDGDVIAHIDKRGTPEAIARK